MSVRHRPRERTPTLPEEAAAPPFLLPAEVDALASLNVELDDIERALGVELSEPFEPDAPHADEFTADELAEEWLVSIRAAARSRLAGAEDEDHRARAGEILERTEGLDAWTAWDRLVGAGWRPLLVDTVLADVGIGHPDLLLDPRRPLGDPTPRDARGRNLDAWAARDRWIATLARACHRWYAATRRGEEDAIAVGAIALALGAMGVGVDAGPVLDDAARRIRDAEAIRLGRDAAPPSASPAIRLARERKSREDAAWLADATKRGFRAAIVSDLLDAAGVTISARGVAKLVSGR